MFAQQNKLKELFDHNGWELVETQVPNNIWIPEIWAIKSLWSPTNCYVFISYEVDPQWEDRNRMSDGVWAINLSLKQPQDWNDDNIKTEFIDGENYQFPISPNFEKRIPEIFDSLNSLRLKIKSLSN